MQKLDVERIARFYKIDLVPLPLPTDDDVSRVGAQRETALLEARRRASTGLQLERARRFLRLAGELGPGNDDEQLLLLALLLDADYQTSLGTPLSFLDPGYRPAPCRRDAHRETSKQVRQCAVNTLEDDTHKKRRRKRSKKRTSAEPSAIH